METVISILEIIGIISFSAAGAMVAIDKETDIFGVVFLSIITCFGGGLLRDIMVGNEISRPIPWLFTRDAIFYIAIATVTSLTVFFAAMIFKKRYVKEEMTVVTVNNILDAIGIGVFAAIGTGTCIEMGAFVAITMGMVSAVFGGLTRDIILGDIPFILRKYVYAVAAIVGSAVYYIIAVYIMPESEMAVAVADIFCMVVVFVIRMVATVFKLNLPKAIEFSKLREAEEDKTVQK